MEQTKLINYLRAGFTCFWMTTDEPNRVKTNIYSQLENWEKPFRVIEWDNLTGNDPNTPLMELTEGPDDSVMFLYNYHWYIDKPKTIQIIQNFIAVWANTGKAIVIVSPVEKIPVELKKSFTLVELPLPKDQEIVDAMIHVAPSDKYLPDKNKQSDIVRVSKGLTRRELENIYALSLVEQGSFQVDVINDYRAQIVRKSGLADILSTDKTFKDVIGYDLLKNQVMETIHNPLAKGIIAIGPTGTGKTSIMQAIANESGKLAIKIRTGKLFSKYQGESDQNVDALINMLTALGDCFCLYDEFEKLFAGVGSSGETDSGTGARMGGRFLEFFEDSPKGNYRGATCNTFKGIPPEYFRPGRWDSAPWYVDLPSQKVKTKILNHYIKKFDLTAKQKIPAMPLWTGAEIEALCHNAKMRNISLDNASKFVLPMAAVAKEEIAAMRKWAEGRTVQAEEITEKLTNGKRKLEIAN
jgi:ATP-dependent 26S proteasome regulatory subunit